jgi:hypothetical protein
LAACALLASRAVAGEVAMIRLAGTPQEVGKTWGEINKRVILQRMDVEYLKKASVAGISEDALIERSQAFLRIVREIAPHWLEEARAIARAAGVREDLYLSFIGTQPRGLFLHECTSYAVARAHAQDQAIFFHKNRDNVDCEQAAYVLESSVKGVNKFIAVCNASAIACCMMVNDKGLAGCADYPVEWTRKDDPAALRPEQAEPRYRGMMNTSALRHVAERASDCGEALKIIEDLVKKGYYAGGKVNGTHWLFVDREGVILEISNNADHVMSKVHTQKVYFSRFDGSAAARRLRDADRPIDFHLFHNVSRDPSICLDTSISGMTVQIDPAHPETLTCAWISLPAWSVSVPLWMGQTKTPACLLNGEAYALGKKTKGKTPLWETVERSVCQGKRQLQEDTAARLPAGKAEQVARSLDQWSQKQAEMLVERLRSSE